MASFYEKNKEAILKSKEKNIEKYKEYMREYQKQRRIKIKIEKGEYDLIQQRLEKRINKFLLEAKKLGYNVQKI